MCGRFISIGPTTIDEMYGGEKKLENRLNNLNVDRKVIRSNGLVYPVTATACIHRCRRQFIQSYSTK